MYANGARIAHPCMLDAKNSYELGRSRERLAGLGVGPFSGFMMNLK
jgi:hypothetical protein